MTAICLLTSILPRRFPRDPRLVQRCERDATVENAKSVALDLGEQRAIHGGHHQPRALGAPVTPGERRERLRIEGPRAFDLVRHQRQESGRELAPEDVRIADAETPQFVLRQIDAAALRVLADVADDVGELERDAEFAGIRSRGGFFVTEYLRRQQSDNSGNAVAVALERGEVLIA